MRLCFFEEFYSVYTKDTGSDIRKSYPSIPHRHWPLSSSGGPNEEHAVFKFPISAADVPCVVSMKIAVYAVPGLIYLFLTGLNGQDNKEIQKRVC